MVGRSCAALMLAATAAGGTATEIVVGGVRVQALSPTLVRVEPRGPRGFENRTTFMVTGRNFTGIPIRLVKQSGGTSVLATDHYTVQIEQSPLPADTCSVVDDGTDARKAKRSELFPDGAVAADRGACCALCKSDFSCSSFVFAGQEADSSTNCWPLAGFSGTKSSRHRELVRVRNLSPIRAVTVSAADGTVLYKQGAASASNLLHWPDPLSEAAYAVTDFPRFFVPEWAVEPMPAGAKVDPELLATNGYDFRNNVDGDTYVFLLGGDMAGWQSSREEFLQLTGAPPLLPDYTWGTWFTFWHQYTEDEAKSDIDRWEQDDLPIDVWALDMNWRYTDHEKDRQYDHPNTKLFPDFADNSTAWFDYLSSKGLKTYFNDHPYPVNDQLTKQEVTFRWEGLTNWLRKGLTYWWFDHNWKFSIPAPFDRVAGNKTSGEYDGLTNVAWGSHLYHTTVQRFKKEPRTVTLTKFAIPDWRPWSDPSEADENPSHHRYPVWWTGDDVTLGSSVHAMVDQGVYGLKAFVHSDCGGDIPRVLNTGGGFMRWIAHCSLGTILRIHGTLGADHRPFKYDAHAEDVIRRYLKLRYRLVPSFVAGGQEVTKTGFPLVARGDLFWPQFPQARANDQYVHLKDTLVAPITDTLVNVTTRDVWVPPGDWQDAWTGDIVTGPKVIAATQPYERVPMWHRRGGLVVTTSKPGTRIEKQDWSELTLEAFPAAGQNVTRSVYALGSAARTDISASYSRSGVSLSIGAAEDGAERGWVLRIHLLPSQKVTRATVDGAVVQATELKPVEDPEYFPLMGAGSAPAPHAGCVAEVRVGASSKPRIIRADVA